MARSRQSGSFHAILLAGIGIALVGAVGYLFYQNIVLRNQIDSSQSSNVSGGAESKVALKEYCAPLEKLCFDYPEDWAIKQNTDANTTSADNFSVVSPDGMLNIQFNSGLGGMGGCCGPTIDGPVTVVSAEKVLGLRIAQSEWLQNRTEEAFVSEVIESDLAVEFSDPNDPGTGTLKAINGYRPQVLLHDSKKLAGIGTYNDIEGKIGLNNVMMGKYASMDASDPNAIGTFIFGTATLGIGDSNQKMYKTSDEAKKQFSMKQYTDAKKILLSARYK